MRKPKRITKRTVKRKIKKRINKREETAQIQEVKQEFVEKLEKINKEIVMGDMTFMEKALQYIKSNIIMVIGIAICIIGVGLIIAVKLNSKPVAKTPIQISKSIYDIVAQYKVGEMKYVVKPSDTLWDLSQKYYANAWMYPVVWGNNTNIIINPDLIKDYSVIYIPKFCEDFQSCKFKTIPPKVKTDLANLYWELYVNNKKSNYKYFIWDLYFVDKLDRSVIKTNQISDFDRTFIEKYRRIEGR